MALGRADVAIRQGRDRHTTTRSPQTKQTHVAGLAGYGARHLCVSYFLPSFLWSDFLYYLLLLAAPAYYILLCTSGWSCVNQSNIGALLGRRGRTGGTAPLVVVVFCCWESGLFVCLCVYLQVSKFLLHRFFLLQLLFFFSPFLFCTFSLKFLSHFPG